MICDFYHNPALKTMLAAVIVTYNPNISILRQLIFNCIQSCHVVYVVDNSPTNEISFLSDISDNIRVIRLDDNYGIAYAQNIGIVESIKLGCSHIIFFDQDSAPCPDMINILLDAYRDLQSIFSNIGAIGPRYFDTHRNRFSPFVKILKFRLIKLECRPFEKYLPVDHLISSGSMISAKTLQQVGFMNESLFIDYVDLEWCERAKSKGYQNYGVCNARMSHSLGDDPIYFMGYPFPSRSPLRHYYIFRNAIWLYRQRHVRFEWKILDFIKLLKKYFFYSIFAKPRHSHIYMMSKGIYHGLIGREGKYT